MGSEISCTVKVGRKEVTGKALLESNEIIFRAPDLRVKIPLPSITRVEANDGVLRITHDGGSASFAIGAKRAIAWADKIRNPKSLLDKLGIKPEHKVAAIGITDITVLRNLAQRTPDLRMRMRKGADAILYQADSVRALARLKQLRPSIKRDGMIWLITPKGKGGVAYDDMLAAARAAGLVDVKISAYNETHTATKLVIPKALR
jgi:hypothetical protein